MVYLSQYLKKNIQLIVTSRSFKDESQTFTKAKLRQMP